MQQTVREVCCYRPRNSSSEWLLSFKEFLNYVSDLYKKIIITGDFNFPRISWSENVVTATGESERFFHNILSDHFLNQLIDIPTRENTVLDLIITNIPDNINIIEVIDPNNFTMFSDHKCVLFDYQDSVTVSHSKDRCNRADFQAMKKTFSGIEFEYADPNSASDINDDWNLWTQPNNTFQEKPSREDIIHYG